MSDLEDSVSAERIINRKNWEKIIDNFWWKYYWEQIWKWENRKEWKEFEKNDLETTENRV